MEDKTYVVYSEEYYFDLKVMRTVLKKKVYNVSPNPEIAAEVKEMMASSLQATVDSGEMNADYEMLTTFSINVVSLEGILTKEEAEAQVINDDYTWCKVGKKM